MKGSRQILIFCVCIWLFGVFAILMGCKSPQQTQIAIETKEKVVERLVPYALPPDSSSIYALFECDSLNNVYLKELHDQKTSGWHGSFSFNNGAFKYDLNKPPDTVYVPAKDSVVYKEVPVEVVKEVEVNKQTDWQIIKGWLGILMLVQIGVLALKYFIKWKLKI
ncbi:hypothetical protein [Dysgonomonas sp. 520]|uniref:hypothetical protein n=1 Tax=Dysgonomonas sp. 520 TaxID=2302931 RepID=UPI0013D3A3C8|nr:hypothetical protein [Dysgonomonas sp. 520]NDW10956.1 hypothetical protein [Dysgonomonas sp. 520]